ncbi:condensation domain-containing protein [Marinobacter sp. OP 3.4]|uniref:condensation domain-containing protein n=1 Tax=Marinobacter sp. OP 3.4 TaxID=3076501 RepID=UPI002E1BAEB6
MNMPISVTPAPRGTGYGEQLWLRLSEVASNNALIVCRLQGEIDPQRVAEALHLTASAHPMLRARVNHRGRTPEFVFSPLPTMPWRVVTRLSEQHWQSLVREELDATISPDDTSLWRATLVHGFDRSELVITCNHAITDALSLQLIVDQVLRLCSGEEPRPAVRPLCHSYEQFLASSGRFKVVARGLASMARQALTPAPPSFRTPVNPGYVSGEPLTTGFRLMELDPHRSRVIIETARRQKQSLHGVIAAISLMASRQALSDQDQGPRSMSLSTAVNVRSKLTGSFDQDIGYFVSGVESRLSVSPDTNLWSLADRANRDVQSRYTADHIAFGVWMKQLALRLRRKPEALVGTAARIARTNLHLTNLGRLMIRPTYGNIRVQSACVIPSAHFLPIPVVCLETHFFNDKLHFGFVYPQPITDPAFVDALHAGVEQQISRLVAHSPGVEPRDSAIRIPTTKGPRHAQPELHS